MLPNCRQKNSPGNIQTLSKLIAKAIISYECTLACYAFVFDNVNFNFIVLMGRKRAMGFLASNALTAVSCCFLQTPRHPPYPRTFRYFPDPSRDAVNVPTGYLLIMILSISECPWVGRVRWFTSLARHLSRVQVDIPCVSNLGDPSRSS